MPDIIELREFYDSPLGQTARRVLSRRAAALWPQMATETLLALGYAAPLLRTWHGQAQAIAALMPAEQGVAYWPREGPNIAGLVDSGNLPLADQSVDRVVMMHALEDAASPDQVLREVWRVLKGNGRLLLIVPNRRGWWAHSERTPFGDGQPYSARQIKNLLGKRGFFADRVEHALYAPPSSSRFLLSLADMLETYGQRLFPGLGGLLLVEAGKQLYGPIQTKSRFAPRLVLPLPNLQGASLPVPAST